MIDPRESPTCCVELSKAVVKSVHIDRTGQPVEVERTAFIAFIEKEQVSEEGSLNGSAFFSLFLSFCSWLFPISLICLEYKYWRLAR